MLYSVVLLALTAISSYPTEAANLEDIMAMGITNCQKRFPIPSDQLQSFMGTKLLKDDSNEASTCFVQCVLEGLGVVSDGALVVDKMQKVTEDYFQGKKKADGTAVNMDLLKKNVEDCAMSERGNIACQKNYRIWKCIQVKGASEMTTA